MEMENFFEESIFTDEEIIIINKETQKEEILKVHRVVLSSRSPVFYNTFKFKDWGEKDEKMIKIEIETTIDIFKSFISLIYSQNFTKVNEENILFFVQLANQFECKEIKNYCLDKIIDYINFENSFQILSIFSNINIKHDGLLNFIANHLEDCFEHSDVSLLDEDNFSEILQLEYVYISESDLMYLIFNWMKVHNTKGDNLFKFIQKDLIDDSFLLKTLKGIKTVKIHRMPILFKVDVIEGGIDYYTQDKKMKFLNNGVTCSKFDNLQVLNFSNGGFIEIPHCESLDSLSDCLTFMIWIYPFYSQGNRLLCKATAGTRDCFTFDIYPNNSLRFIAKSVHKSVPENIPSYQWTFVAVSSSKIDGTTMFVNDKVVFRDKNPTLMLKTKNPLMIGACSNRNNNFNGYMKYIQVCNDSLPKTSIMNIYKKQKKEFQK
eukprot:gene657-8158_t